MLPGWEIQTSMPTPAGWSWRQDEHLLFLCSPEKVEAVFSTGISAGALSVAAVLVLESVRRRNGHVAVG